MKIAVVGSDGYIGRYLVRRLVARDHVVSSLDAGVYGRPRHTGTIHVFSSTAISDALASLGPDCVVWLAAYAHDPAGQISRLAMRRNNALRPVRCCRPDWRSIFVSSLSTFSHTGAYPASKRLLESMIFSLPYWRERCRILRFGTIFGPALQGDEASWRGHLLLNSMVMSAVREGVIRISDPNIRRPVLSLRHAVDALVRAVEAEGPCGTVENHYDVSGTLRDFASAVLELGFRHAHVEEGKQNSLAVDRRDYGWGPFDGTRISAELGELLRFCRRNQTADFPDLFPPLYEFVRTHETENSPLPPACPKR